MMTFTPSAATLQLVTLLAKATLLLAAAFGATSLLRRASAGARHLVWLGVLGAVLMLPALAAWTPFRLAILPSALVGERATVSTQTASQPNEAPSGRLELQRDGSAVTASPNASVLPNTPNEASVASEPTSSSSQSSVSAWKLAAMVWGGVALALIGWLAYGFYSVSRIVRRATPLDERDWTHPLYEIADRLGVERTPRVVRSTDVKMPFAAGVLQPTIVLPAESDAWDTERRSAVLMHELAHIRRRDLVGHTLGRVACALYWFHPLVWSATRRLRIESERACDDLALTSGLRATNYAEHLLDIVSSIRQPQTPAVAIPMADRKEFEGRMLAILDPDLRRRAGRAQSFALVGGLAAIVMVVAGAVPAAARSESLVSNTAPIVGRVKSTTGTKTDTNSVARTDTHTDMRTDTRIDQNTSADAESSASTPKLHINFANPRLAQLFDTTGAKNADDRLDALLKVLRTDSSAELRRVAAWGLEQGAERADIADALAYAVTQDRDARVREMAAWALASGSTRTQNTAALVAAMRKDSDEHVRSTATWALGSLGSESLGSDFVAAAEDPSARVRALAMWALGSAASGKAPRVVMDALADTSKEVRKFAAWALFNYEDPAANSALENALNKETEPWLRTAYVRALGATGGAAASTLARLLDSKDPELRAAVVKALADGSGGPWPMPMPRPRPNP